MQKITLNNLAEEFGTSKNTISKALRGAPGVSKQLIEKVTARAREIGYGAGKDQPPTLCFALVCRKVFLEEPSFWAGVFAGVWEFTGKNGINLRTVTINGGGGDDEAYTRVINAKCDGHIVVGAVSEDLLKRIAATGKPLVVADHFSPDVDCDYVNISNENGVYKAVRCLRDNGHRHIGFINNVEAACSFQARKRGFLAAAEDMGLIVDPHYVWDDAVYIDTSYYKEKLHGRVRQPNFPTAFVCVNDHTALAFCEALKELEIAVPGDISIIGFDHILARTAPFLTTVSVPRGTLGALAVERLVRRVNDKDAPFDTISVSTTLIENSSVKNLNLL